MDGTPPDGETQPAGPSAIASVEELTVTGTQRDALVDAANDGVSVGGLVVDRTDEGYSLATPTREWTGLSAADLRDVADDAAAYVTNWYYWSRVVGERRRGRGAFLRWLEGGDRDVPDRYAALVGGVEREWGQLHLWTTLAADGTRRYHLRHVDDVGSDEAALTVHETPAAFRELVTEDDRGRYRPLKTAPTLRTGWHAPALTPSTLLDVVDVVYPATVANWHREREGSLDVTHWDACASRQTGIYDVIDELDPAAVERIAEACCVDSQCLKRREWEFDEGTPLDVDGGDGAFPCREPCSLVVAAARKWATLEREAERTYEFSLTPSEKEQLEEILDAVADGRVDDIREADVYDGANRYRARYLRAKRLDADGNLSGTPTRPDDED
jgi:hypothetical protein